MSQSQPPPNHYAQVQAELFNVPNEQYLINGMKLTWAQVPESSMLNSICVFVQYNGPLRGLFLGFYKDENEENKYWVNTNRLNTVISAIPKSTFSRALRDAGWKRQRSTKKSPETAKIMKDHGVPLTGWVAYTKPDNYDDRHVRKAAGRNRFNRHI